MHDKAAYNQITLEKCLNATQRIDISSNLAHHAVPLCCIVVMRMNKICNGNEKDAIFRRSEKMLFFSVGFCVSATTNVNTRSCSAFISSYRSSPCSCSHSRNDSDAAVALANRHIGEQQLSFWPPRGCIVVSLCFCIHRETCSVHFFFAPLFICLSCPREPKHLNVSRVYSAMYICTLPSIRLYSMRCATARRYGFAETEGKVPSTADHFVASGIFPSL